MLAVVSWSVGIFLYAAAGVLVALRMMLYDLRPEDLTPPYWVAMGACSITVLAGARIVEMADTPMVTAMRGLAAGTAIVFWGFASWLIPVLVAAGWWRHVRHGVPLRYEATWWSIVFPLGMYAVAGLYLGQADRLPLVRAIGAAELWVAMAAWAVVLLAMVRHLVRTVLLGARRVRGEPAGPGRLTRPATGARHAGSRPSRTRTGVRICSSTGARDALVVHSLGSTSAGCRCRRLASSSTTSDHRPAGAVREPEVTHMPAPADRDKALDTALAQIDRQFGKGSVMRLGDDVRAPIEVIPTGSVSLDVALGIGGLPRGRVVEIYGPESSGKTTVALHAVANAQKAGGIAAFIDAEHALDPEYAKKLGVDTDALLVSQPDTGEQALEIADMLIRSGALDIIVIDSVAALVPRAEIEGEMGDSHVGLQARLMSQALRKITGALSNSKTTAIFINQLREKIGVMFGSPETTTGGKALKFYASVRLDVRRIETLKDGTEPVGNRTRCKIVKNKMAPPFKQAEFDILYGHGISREGGLIDMGVEHGFVRKSGAWYTYDGDQLGQGKENARSFLRDNPDLGERAREEDQGEAGHRPACRRPGRGVCSPRPRSASDPWLSQPLVASRSLQPAGQGPGRLGRASPCPAVLPTRRRTPTRSRWRGPSCCASSPWRRAAAPSSPTSWPSAAPTRRSPSGCSTGSRRSGSSTTRRSPRCSCAPSAPGAGWADEPSPRSCAARGSTTRRPGRRWRPSTRSPSASWRASSSSGGCAACGACRTTSR